ncbi:MAG: Crp/Fnr family transcriptional regulator [Burkholderiales bacterium]|nr:Crp/Fnr family transcriptional regulator [Burkholderiales bacterium]MDE2626475.1 Crp/Fnr family transcriptional regulator [Burkholderiales bacterium]
MELLATAATAATAATKPARPLYQRARAPSAAELADIPWLHRLDPIERQAATRDLKVVQVAPGELLCRIGRPATFWFGVIDGLLKMSNDAAQVHGKGPRAAQGVPITFTGMPPGGWFGEGTVIKREVYRYNIQALRKSVVAGLGVETFHWLLERSIPFNRFITQQLNERLGQFIAAREIDRLTDADARVARSLAALFHPVLYPGVGTLLRITQQELGYLVGLSRQRVNEALQTLQARGCIRIEYGGVRVTDIDALRRGP